MLCATGRDVRPVQRHVLRLRHYRSTVLPPAGRHLSAQPLATARVLATSLTTNPRADPLPPCTYTCVHAASLPPVRIRDSPTRACPTTFVPLVCGVARARADLRAAFERLRRVDDVGAALLASHDAVRDGKEPHGVPEGRARRNIAVRCGPPTPPVPKRIVSPALRRYAIAGDRTDWTTGHRADDGAGTGTKG
jgi:hypothetical protein